MAEFSVSLWQKVVAARERFIRAGIPPDQAAIDAEVLARHDRDGIARPIWRDVTSPRRPDAGTSYEALVIRREQREPVAYIIGHREFWNLGVPRHAGGAHPAT